MYLGLSKERALPDRAHDLTPYDFDVDIKRPLSYESRPLRLFLFLSSWSGLMLLVQDPELCRAFKQGDKHALKTVYLHYAPLLYRYLARGFSFQSKGQYYSYAGLSDIAEQESIVQETFVRCFADQARENYDNTRPYLYYLQRACRNQLLQEQKKRRRLTLHESTEDIVQDNDNDESLSAQSQLECEEVQKHLRTFLSTCDEREQLVFEALYERGESQAQAAERLNIGRMQVRTSLQRLRKGILKHFRETGYLQQLQHNPHAHTQLLIFLGISV
ncbi:MAG: hypothetical protein CL920_25445 [Deltaproteobacteria bacterium]|nr:hypothetical protein [Deltaproteobacteria bacterium]